MTFPRISAGQLAAITFMIALVGGTFWLRSQLEPSRPKEKEVRLPARADYYTRKAHLTAMSENGDPLYYLNAAQVLHYPDDSVDMNKVRLHYLGQNAKHNNGDWRLKADHGHRPPGGSQNLHLRGHVVAFGHTAHNLPLTLHTPALTVLFQSRRLATKAPVRVNSDGQRHITAVGMRANLNTNTVEFMKDVHAQFTP